MARMAKVDELFMRLNSRERIAVIVGTLGVVALFAYLIIDGVFKSISETERLTATRLSQLEQIQQLATRFTTLDQRLSKLQKSFAESELTFEQVTQQLDSIVKQSIGSSTTYDFKRGRSPTPIGKDYQKQEFTLRVASLSLEQVVDLLFRLQHGDSPLFLGKVDLIKSSKDSSFSATLEIFSVLKASS